MPTQKFPHFKLIKNEEVAEIGAQAYLFEHIATGARVTALKNNDKNKAFIIGFATIPQDNTGVAHILEHAALAGSRKYPLTDVFNELTKGGLLTFINAFTGYTHTKYPFSTRHAKEYFQVMDVYLDLTLHPLLREEIFLNEGWHYHLERPEDPLRINGIVYNEMKGDYADPMVIGHNTLFELLLPGSSYVYDSGGMPDAIPDLSYKQFKAFHRRSYQPGNAIIYLYGDAPLKEELAFIADRLSGFGRRPASDSFRPGRVPPPFQHASKTYAAPAGPQGDTSILLFGHRGPDWELQTQAGMDMLSHLLHKWNASPLKQDLLGSGLCRYCSGMYNADVLHSLFITELKDCRQGTEQELNQRYTALLRDIVAQGFAPKLLQGIINWYDLDLRQLDSNPTRGFLYGYRLMQHMQFQPGANPFDCFKHRQLFDRLRPLVEKEHLLESLVQTYLLDSPQAVVRLLPEPGKAAREEAKRQKRLQAYKAGLSQAQLARLVDKTQALQTFFTESGQEDTSIIPRLHTRDLPRDTTIPVARATKIAGAPALFTDIDTAGIVYLQAGFDLSALPTRMLPMVDAWAHCLLECGTQTRSPAQLAEDIACCTGKLEFQLTALPVNMEPDKVRTHIWFSLSASRQRLAAALDLLADILCRATFNNQDMVHQVLQKRYVQQYHAIMREGICLPHCHVEAPLHPAGRYREQLLGYPSFAATKDLAHSQTFDQLVQGFTEMRRRLIKQNNLCVNITASPSDLQDALLAEFIHNLPQGEVERFPGPEQAAHPHRAFLTSNDVVFAYWGAVLPAGLHSGHLQVMRRLVEESELYQRIRLSGGAYGARADYDPVTNGFVMSSYRDPHVSTTFDQFRGAADTLCNLQLTDHALEQFIIGTFADADRLRDPFQTGIQARNNYFMKLDASWHQDQVARILSTRLDHLRAGGHMLKQSLDKGCKSIIGDDQHIRRSEHLFTDFVALGSG